MSISILNRGASGGLKPELTVTAPSGSTIDLLQNGIIVATYTLEANETEHTFVVKVGTYTVRGTLGTDSDSAEVVIDAVGKYTVKLAYELYIFDYRNGGLQIELTYPSSNYDAYLAEITNTYMAGKQTSEVGGWNSYHPKEAIDISAYSYVYAEILCGNSTFHDFHLMTEWTRQPSSSSTYKGVYVDNAESVTGSNTRLGVKMTGDYIRLVKYTNNPPQDAVYLS